MLRVKIILKIVLLGNLTEEDEGEAAEDLGEEEEDDEGEDDEGEEEENKLSM